MKNQYNYTGIQIFALTTLRIFIGWHFLYEGLAKLFNPGWSAKEYLLGSVGVFSSLFTGIAKSGFLLSLTDVLNEWGLVLIGLGLFLGLLSKPCKIFGIVLLALYYFAYPPFLGLDINAGSEGNYWIVNKNLIEMAALLVLYLFPVSHLTGIERFFYVNKKSSLSAN